jgi:hypothetical protein
MSKLKFKKIDKQVLKEMYPELGSLPIHPKKHGFISPLGHWLRANPKLIKESINSLPEFIKINEPELNRLSSSVERKNFHEMKILWSIVVLNQWLTKNF